jgi:hypothetical protein
MEIRLKPFVYLALFVFVTVRASAQVAPQIEAEEEPKGLMEQRIEEAVNNAPLRAGAFYVLPRLTLWGGYDSNSLLLASDEEDDFSFQASPGVVAALPFRQRALLEIWDDVNFIYYRDTPDLTGIFNTVGGRFTMGGNRVLFSVGDTFSIRRAGPTQEFDFPTDEINNNFDTNLTVGLGARSEARVGFATYTTEITEEIVNTTGVPLSQFYDQNSYRVTGGFRRYVSSYTSFTADAYFEKWDFAEGSLQPDADIFAALGGFTFKAKGNIVGEVTLGYKHMVPDEEERGEFNGLIGRGAVTFRAGERTTLGLEYTRDARPSVTDGNWFFIENRVAPSIEFYITRNFSIFGIIGWEKNSYPRPGLIVTSDGLIIPGEVDDTAIESTVSLRYKFAEIWQFFVSGARFNRDSNAPNSEKERDVVAAGVQLVF